MKKIFIQYFLKKFSSKFLKMSGKIAERFHEKDSAEYDDLQEKFYYWITAGIRDF